ncbi:TusE/DsrC/DsvC family sulfur relay protein [Chloroflexota bacterium]
MQVVTPVKEAVVVVVEAGDDTFKSCYQCGLCSGSCPWNLVRNFIPRKIMHQTQLGLVDFEDEDVWLCLACGSCAQRCPRGVGTMDVMRDLRRVVTELGLAEVPDSLRIALKNIAGTGNPQGEAEDRTHWAEGLDIKLFTEGTDLMYYSCCLPSYDPNCKASAEATVGVLKKAVVDFGILGTTETCCGGTIRKVGNETLFRNLAERNINAFNESGVKNIITSSPHCYHTFKNDYPSFSGNFNVVHTTQLLAQLIDDGRLKPANELNKKVAYHDPCYLGRHNGTYEEPRKVLRSIPGLDLVEFPDNRENSICCGGGSGRVWMETKKGQRFSDLRLEQAINQGAEVLAVACPACMAMFKDSVVSMDKSDIIEIKDISELVRDACAGTSDPKGGQYKMQQVDTTFILATHVDEEGFMRESHRWNPEIASQLGKQQGLEQLTDDHWKVVNSLRDHYLKFGIPTPVAMLRKDTGMKLEQVKTLFPAGLGRGAVKVAGLPKPPGLYPW